MKAHEIYGLPAPATDQEINAAAAQHAIECARGMHGATGPVRMPPPAGMEWSQARSEWVYADGPYQGMTHADVLADREDFRRIVGE